MAPPNDLRRPFKRPAISDQQRRRELALLRQSQNRSDSQTRARRLASSVVSLQPDPEPEAEAEPVPEVEMGPEFDQQPVKRELNVVDAVKLRGPEVRRWFARQLMLPEWMIDVPPNLNSDWFASINPNSS